ncbi:MAG TPA: Hsp20/alpha crystallin family protein [Bdellovibrionota bacterium]|nr:Hsp20/alpha crystallin family protein [Bdellovibrionota bacterium]
MAISPTGKPPAPLAPHQKMRTSEQERAERAAKEARARVEDSERQIKEADRDTQLRIDQIKADSNKEVETESIRQEAAIEAERNKGYAAIRATQAANQAELNRIRREGEREIAQARTYYRDTIDATDKRGTEQLRDLEMQQFRQMEHNQQSTAVTLDEASSKQVHDVERAKQNHEMKLAELERQARDDYERTRENTAVAKEKSEQSFQQKYQAVKSGHEETIGRIEGDANASIRQIRTDTAAKIAAYGARQDDPFYRMIDVAAELSDEGDHFLLTATIPEHERDHVSIAVRGDQVVLSGTRRNEEKLDLGPGRSKRTDSYQSFHESFALDWPVNARELTRTFEGDELVVRIPKKSTLSQPLERAKPEIAKTRQERPKFPENLPISKYLEAERATTKADLDAPKADDSTPPTRKRGARTLA